MGFWDKEKVYHNSFSSRLYDHSTDLIEETLIGATLQNRNIGDDLISNIVNGVGFRANILWQYAYEGHLPYGLPQGARGLLPHNAANNVAAVLQETICPQGVEIYFVSVDKQNNGTYLYSANYQAKDTAGELTGYPEMWYYNESTHAYPILDVDDEYESAVSPYYPIMPVRVNGTFQMRESDPHYLEYYRALGLIGIKPATLVDALVDQGLDAGDNPVEGAYVVLGVELGESDPLCSEYLYEFFLHYHGNQEASRYSYEAWLAGEGVMPQSNTVNIQDANYRMELTWMFSEHTVRKGKIGRPGHVTKHYDRRAHSREITYSYGQDSSNTTRTRTVFDDAVVLRKQISVTHYSEVMVVGLTHENFVQGYSIFTSMADVFDGTDNPAFLIPLRKDIMTRMGGVKTHTIMYNAIRLIVNDKNVVKLKWYQTGIFKVILAIVIAVITFFFPPFGIAAGSIMAAGYAIAQMILMQILFPVVMKVIQDIFGEEFAILIGAIISIWTGGTGMVNMISTGMSVIGSTLSLVYKGKLTEIAEEIKEAEEDLEEVREEEKIFESNLRVGLMPSMHATFASRKSCDYVRSFRMGAKEHILNMQTTTNFTDLGRFTDRPASPISLGNTLSFD